MTDRKWLSAGELEQLDDDGLKEYSDDLACRAKTSERHLQTIITSAIRTIDEMLSRRQRPFCGDSDGERGP
jgi:hypothetical protein